MITIEDLQGDVLDPEIVQWLITHWHDDEEEDLSECCGAELTEIQRLCTRCKEHTG